MGNSPTKTYTVLVIADYFEIIEAIRVRCKSPQRAMTRAKQLWAMRHNRPWKDIQRVQLLKLIDGAYHGKRDRTEHG